ncbi:YraN family protein [Cellulosilyticum sp. I15G10I2]|uniref:YraN family protein n=1 Tax=Cellulosilyticum sp. I15G10I2 TaxID=1892843 RepID=UPI001FA7C1A3|nr:YraN family protein [Cellulosilyticum sp. I15G10I2]
MSYMQKQSMQKNKRLIGAAYEKLATDSLTAKGYTIICNNYRCKVGEIDIVAKIQECIVFIEVKYRANSLYGFPREAVNYKKQQRIKLTAKCYLRQHEKYEVSCRFDVIEILGDVLTHIEGAF